MTDDTDSGDTDLDSVADRLEAALDKIARRLDAPTGWAQGGPGQDDPVKPALAARLDGLIARLRDALGETAEH